MSKDEKVFLTEVEFTFTDGRVDLVRYSSKVSRWMYCAFIYNAEGILVASPSPFDKNWLTVAKARRLLDKYGKSKK